MSSKERYLVTMSVYATDVEGNELDNVKEICESLDCKSFDIGKGNYKVLKNKIVEFIQKEKQIKINPNYFDMYSLNYFVDCLNENQIDTENRFFANIEVSKG